jgi:ABC-type nitrate/sulfonate/bicarbonate transport system substrate-binding protein
MNKSRIGLTLLGGALLLSASAFAGNNNKGTLRLDENVTVDGTPLQAGNYKVQWDGSGSDVKVTLSQGSRTVATVPAHVTEQKAAAQADAYGSTNQPEGGKALTAIYFGGKHYALQVEPSTAATQSQASPTPAQ